MRFLKSLILSCFVLVGLLACQSEPNMEGQDSKDQSESALEVRADANKKVEVDLINREGVETGVAILQEVEEGVKVTLEAHHLSAGEHGFHIHDKGKCEAPEFETAGSHFNPEDKQHGLENPEGPHAGDMENITVQKDGMVQEELINPRVTLEKGEANSLLQEAGTTLMIHEKADDNTSQPAGNAGERIVCGVIYSGEN